MSDELRADLDGVIEQERRRFGGAHRGNETTLYVRAITPRRWARRAAFVVPALLVAVGVSVVAASRDDAALEPAAEVASASPMPTASADPDARPGEAGWTVGSLTIDPRVTARPVTESAGWVFAESQYCLALETFGRLRGGTDAPPGWHPGGFASSSGAVIDLHVREMPTAEAAAHYLRDLMPIARRCVEDLAAEWVDASVSRAEIAGVPGEAVRFEAAAGVLADESWRLWVHVDGATLVAAVAEPGAPAREADIVAAWLAGGPR